MANSSAANRWKSWAFIIGLALFLTWGVQYLRTDGRALGQINQKNLAAMKQVREQYGLDTSVTWKHIHGKLEEVTIDFKAEQVMQRPYEELEAIAQDMVDSVFSEPPGKLRVRVTRGQ